MLRELYKHILGSEKNLGELLWWAQWHLTIRTLSPPLPVMQIQQSAESLLTLMENLCRGTQNRVTDICEFRIGYWEQGGWATHDTRRAGWGISATVLEPSLNSWQDTRHFSKGKFIKPWSGETGKGGQTRELEAMPSVSCAALVYFESQYYCAFFVWQNTHNMKSTILTIFKYTAL